MDKKIIDTLLTGEFGQAIKDEPLKTYTTMHIGGPADILVKPESVEDVQEIIKIAKVNNIPLTILGRGSNLLIRDKGIRGIVLAFKDNFSDIEIDGNLVKAQSGALLRDVALKSFEANLTGMEAVSGIPGSIGGAIIMNAGAYGTEMKDIVKTVTAMDKNGEVFIFNNEDMDFSYRHSIAEEKGLIILETVFELSQGNPEDIKEAFEDFDYKRSSRQPLEKHSAGSTFKRPEGYFASKLIDDAGLRGFAHGEAQVSDKHTGFLINNGESTCENMLELIEQVKDVVRDKYQVELEREVKLIGEE